MGQSHITKIRNRIGHLKRRANWKTKLGIAATSAVLIFGAIWWISLPLPQNYETEIPAHAQSYSATPVACDCLKDTASRISLRFAPGEPAENSIPAYKTEEIPAQGKTIVTFDNVTKIDGQFDYGQIVGSPLIDSMDYNIKNSNLVVEIDRKGAYLPARVVAQGSRVTIVLEPGNRDYPTISNQKPADNSAAFPALHPISFDAVLASPLENAVILFQDQAINSATTTASGNDYHFSFDERLEIDKDYSVKAIITDSQGRTTVSSWSFTGQIPSAALLGKDRFKYLGWWGQINADGVAVRKGFETSSEKAGTLSSANRVKVIKEVYGDWVNGNNLWYRIDGGMYPGDYVFSDFVTPMEQPSPPQTFKIPDKVSAGQKWIDVDLSKKILTLFDYDKPVFATYISPGRPENPTLTGIYRIWYKLYKAEMKGGPPLHSYKYDLKNIPWTMFYNDDYAIHGTYWHDKFGTPQSAGCSNMTQGDAKYIFDNTLPIIPAGKQSVFSSDANPGTVVFNHD